MALFKKRKIKGDVKIVVDQVVPSPDWEKKKTQLITITEGMTNGEVLRKVFPDGTVFDDYETVQIKHPRYWMTFDRYWWNRPYEIKEPKWTK